MSEYKSKYKGQQIDNILGNAAQKSDLYKYATKAEVESLINNALGNIPTPDVSGQISEHNRDAGAHPYIQNKVAEIEDKIPTKVSDLPNDKGYLTEHQDISHLATKEEVEEAISNIPGGGTADLSKYATKAELANKVDKVDGKQLSTEDFTTLLKQKLDGLQNYDDTGVQQAVSKLRTDLDTLVSGDTTTAIKTFNEVIAFLEGIADTESLDSIIASIEQQIARKQDKIDDLETIRSGAAKGATAIQDVSGKIDGDGVVMRIEKVSALPTNPDANTLYIIV